MEKRIKTLWLLMLLAGCGSVGLRNDPVRPPEVLPQQKPLVEEKALKEESLERLQRKARKAGELIELLAHESYHVREKATRELLLLGEPALAPLKEALESKDPEVQVRAKKLIKGIPGFVRQVRRDFACAVEVGDLGKAKEIIGFDLFDPADKAPEYAPAGVYDCYLHLAAALGHEDIVKFFISWGLDVNEKSLRRRTALHEAGTADVARVLIENGADVNARDVFGDTPLHFAVENERNEVARVIIEYKADLNSKNKLGFAPLHTAALRENLTAGDLLIAGGAAVNLEDSYGKTPLDRAVQCNCKRVEELIRAHGGESGDSFTNLLDAALAGNVEKMKEYIGRGVSIDVRSESGDTLLDWAVLTGDFEVARICIDLGADLNAASGTGRTPLHLAAWEGNAKIARLLVEKGADTDRRDSSGKTPLHLAARRGRREVASFLVSRDAALNVRDNEEKTALDIAREESHKRVCYMLGANGAKTAEELDNEKDKDGE